jgi:hypothetical protein
VNQGVTTADSDMSSAGALLTSSEVDCWGDGEYGKNGQNIFAESEYPVAVK